MEEFRINWMRLGNRVAEMRMARGITQMELAEMTGLSLTHIGYLEQGKRHGKFETYAQIVAALGYSLDDLMATELSTDLTKCLVWELSRALSGCEVDKQESIVQIVRDMVHMIQLFHEDGTD